MGRVNKVAASFCTVEGGPGHTATGQNSAYHSKFVCLLSQRPGGTVCMASIYRCPATQNIVLAEVSNHTKLLGVHASKGDGNCGSRHS